MKGPNIRWNACCVCDFLSDRKTNHLLASFSQSSLLPPRFPALNRLSAVYHKVSGKRFLGWKKAADMCFKVRRNERAKRGQRRMMPRIRDDVSVCKNLARLSLQKRLSSLRSLMSRESERMTRDENTSAEPDHFSLSHSSLDARTSAGFFGGRR